MPKKKAKVKDIANKEAAKRPEEVDGKVAVEKEVEKEPEATPDDANRNVEAAEPAVVQKRVYADTRKEEGTLRDKIKEVVGKSDTLKISRAVAEAAGRWTEHEKLDGEITTLLRQRATFQDRLNEIYRPRRAPIIVRGLKDKKMSTKTLVERLQKKLSTTIPHFVRRQLQDAAHMEKDPAIGCLADLRRFPAVKATMDNIFKMTETETSS